MDNVQTERVIFRQEKNPYVPGGVSFLAAFPDDRVAPGRIGCTPFYFNQGMVFFEPYTEVDRKYYTDKTRIIHKTDDRVPKLLQAVTDYYSNEVPAKFRAVEKIMH